MPNLLNLLIVQMLTNGAITAYQKDWGEQKSRALEVA